MKLKSFTSVAVPVTLCLSRYIGGKGPGHPIMEEISSNPWNILKLYLLAAVWAPMWAQVPGRAVSFRRQS